MEMEQIGPIVPKKNHQGTDGDQKQPVSLVRGLGHGGTSEGGKMNGIRMIRSTGAFESGLQVDFGALLALSLFTMLDSDLDKPCIGSLGFALGVEADLEAFKITRQKSSSN